MVPSLTSLALKAIVANIALIDDVHLVQVPPPYLFHIWRSTKKSDSWSLSISDIKHWGLFVKSLINNSQYTTQKWPTLDMWWVLADFTMEKGTLSQNLKPAISPSFHFITHLRLSTGVECLARDMVLLTEIANLGVLEIIQPLRHPNRAEFPRVTDAVVREWAGKDNPFPVLRVLRIWGEDFTTAKSLQYLASFPSLAVYDVAGHPDDWPDNTVPPVYWTIGRHTWSGGVANGLLRTYRKLCRPGSIQYSDVPYVKSQSQRMGLPRSVVRYDDIKRHETFELDLRASESARCRRPSSPEPVVSESSWGFFTYSQVGRRWSNADLVDLGLDVGSTYPQTDGMVLPIRPMAFITSRASKGQRGREMQDLSREEFGRYRTFFRSNYTRREEPNRKGSGPSTLRKQSGSHRAETKRATSATDAPQLRKKQKVSLSDFM